MADTVSVKIIKETKTSLVVQLNGVSDGTGENAVTKIDKSTLTTFGEPTALDIQEIFWAVQGYYAQLIWDGTTDEVIGNYSGGGYIDYEMTKHLDGAIGSVGGLIDGTDSTPGDIKLTTPAGAVGASYLLLIVFRKRDVAA